MTAKKSAKKIGRLLIIGGAEDPDEKQMKILPHFVKMSGGKRARILICGTPSAEPGKKERVYAKLFGKIGVAEVIDSGVRDRHDGESEEAVARVDRATGIFISGGDQLRLTAMMAGTKFGDRIRARLWEEGLVVAGTSAGASAMSSTMIIGGNDEGTVRRSDVELAPGLGYWRDACIDTHFAQRGRVTRLLTLFSQNPQVLGIGIDENTAIDVTPGKSFTVMGEGTVLVFDGRVSYSNAARVQHEDPLALADVSLHALSREYGFDLEKKRPIDPDGRVIERA